MTIAFPKVDNFHLLSKEEAEKVLYDELLSACEEKGVLLLPEGHVVDVDRYIRKKLTKTTFDVERVQRAFFAADYIYQPGPTLMGVNKPFFEHHPQGGYVGGGELMAAMMLKGYPATFGEEGKVPRALRADFPVSQVCSRSHRTRLFVGEAHFKGVMALLDKHKNRHPTLGRSIVATELDSLGRSSDSCPTCIEEETFCSESCERIQQLKNLGVKVILGFDGTQIHTHPFTQGKRFERIHWNCPHDKSSYHAQTLPPILQQFFASAAQSQEVGDRIHVTLAQPFDGWDKGPFYQAVIYHIHQAATSAGYANYAKRPFGAERYPGYEHEQTGSAQSAAGSSKLREFVFIKGDLPIARRASRVRQQFFRAVDENRMYYVRDTDNESSSYSDSD